MGSPNLAIGVKLILLLDNHGSNISLSDTFSNYHTYEIDWTPDQVTWLVDGQVGRTLKKSDTWNETTNQWMYPQTPARVQLSLWPGGLESNGEGTIDWAGGLVNWNTADITNNGYYYATFQSVTVDCFNATSAPGTNTGVSYTYNNAAGTNDTVVDGTKSTVLKSLLGTGTDMNAGDPGTSSGSSAAPSATAETVPGRSGENPGTDNHAGDSAAASSGSSVAATSTTSDSTSTSGSSNGAFSQGGGSSGSTTKSGAEKLGASQEKVLKGSVFAGIVAVVAVMAL